MTLINFIETFCSLTIAERRMRPSTILKAPMQFHYRWHNAITCIPRLARLIGGSSRSVPRFNSSSDSSLAKRDTASIGHRVSFASDSITPTLRRSVTCPLDCIVHFRCRSECLCKPIFGNFSVLFEKMWWFTVKFSSF